VKVSSRTRLEDKHLIELEKPCTPLTLESAAARIERDRNDKCGEI
jgi:hypothetical protein